MKLSVIALFLASTKASKFSYKEAKSADIDHSLNNIEGNFDNSFKFDGSLGSGDIKSSLNNIGGNFKNSF